MDSSDCIYVVDSSNHRIQKFDNSGNFIAEWGTAGSANGKFDGPFGIAVDPFSHLMVSDSGNIRIQDLWPIGDGGFVTKWGGFGRGEGQFDRPSGIAVTPSGTVYVVDSRNNRIQVVGPPSPPTHAMTYFAWTLSCADGLRADSGRTGSAG